MNPTKENSEASLDHATPQAAQGPDPDVEQNYFSALVGFRVKQKTQKSSVGTSEAYASVDQKPARAVEAFARASVVGEDDACHF
jgi:hypothetical protein